jgi:transcriptional regulator with XRE-family HTH domain
MRAHEPGGIRPTVAAVPFHKKLSGRMQLLGISQRRLAAYVGSHQNIVCRWCKGERYPIVEQLVRMAELLECTTDYLVMENVSDPRMGEPLDRDELKLIDIARVVGIETALKRVTCSPEHSPLPGRGYGDMAGGDEQGKRPSGVGIVKNGR